MQLALGVAAACGLGWVTNNMKTYEGGGRGHLSVVRRATIKYFCIRLLLL